MGPIEHFAGRMWTSLRPQAKVVRVQESDLRDDEAQKRVLRCLKELSRRQTEVMFVISQLHFSDYLGKPCYAASAKNFLRPKDLGPEYRRGEFDILVIHSQYGIVIGEIKSVNSNHDRLYELEIDIDTVIERKVRQAISALNESEFVIRQLTLDISSNLLIRKTVILPNVTRTDLKRVFSRDPHLEQELAECLLKNQSGSQLLDIFLLQDDLFDYEHPGEVLNLQNWWSKCVSNRNDSSMDLDIYLRLVARFCGPATTVKVHCVTPPRLEIRTSGDAVSAVGEKMALITLTPEQVDLLTRAPPRLLVTGPPGTGKSITLALMAISWMKQGHTVHVVSVDEFSYAASCMITEMLRRSLNQDRHCSSGKETLRLFYFDFMSEDANVEKAIDTLSTVAAETGELYMICDEFYTGRYTERYNQFLGKLCARHPEMSMWIASPWKAPLQLPNGVDVELMTTPLRCPPAVLREVWKGVEKFQHMSPYAQTCLKSTFDGTDVLRLYHLGPLHRGHLPIDCFICGQAVANILQRLGVDQEVSVPTMSDSTTTSTTTAVNSIATRNSTSIRPPSLQYRDVFVLASFYDASDDVTDDSGRVKSAAKSFAYGLLVAGIPVRVIRKEEFQRHVHDTAVAHSNAVTLTRATHVSGLERKLVVWLSDGDLLTDYVGRLFAMSRCTSQLVIVETPPLLTDVSNGFVEILRRYSSTLSNCR